MAIPLIGALLRGLKLGSKGLKAGKTFKKGFKLGKGFGKGTLLGGLLGSRSSGSGGDKGDSTYEESQVQEHIHDDTPKDEKRGKEESSSSISSGSTPAQNAENKVDDSLAIELEKEKARLSGLTKEKSIITDFSKKSDILITESNKIIESQERDKSTSRSGYKSPKSESPENYIKDSHKSRDKKVRSLTHSELIELLRDSFDTDKLDEIIELLKSGNSLSNICNELLALSIKSSVGTPEGKMTESLKKVGSLGRLHSMSLTANKEIESAPTTGTSNVIIADYGESDGTVSEINDTASKAMGASMLAAGALMGLSSLFGGEEPEVSKMIDPSKPLDKEEALSNTEKFMKSSVVTPFRKFADFVRNELTLRSFDKENITAQKVRAEHIGDFLASDHETYNWNNYRRVIQEAQMAHEKFKGDKDVNFARFSNGAALGILNDALMMMTEVDRQAAAYPESFTPEHYKTHMNRILEDMRTKLAELYGKTYEDYKKFTEETVMPVYGRVTKKGEVVETKTLWGGAPIKGLSKMVTDEKILKQYQPDRPTFEKVEFELPKQYHFDQTISGKFPIGVNLSENVVPRLTHPIKLDDEYFGVSDILTSNYLENRDGTIHKGIDIAGKKDQTIYHPFSGRVTEVSGGKIDITSDDGTVARYYHTKNQLKEGTEVEAGSPIAKIRFTAGDGTGPHVHMETWKSGRTVNPFKVIQQKVLDESGPDSNASPKDTGKGAGEDSPLTAPLTVIGPTIHQGSPQVSNTVIINNITNDAKSAELK